MSRNKGSLGVGVDEAEVRKMLAALEKVKGNENQKLSMYDDLPKRTFARKEKPPFGLTVFKVKLNSNKHELHEIQTCLGCEEAFIS
jgi:hypothetical protein